MALEIIILAAGRGSRMRADLPKVLHRIGGVPLLQHIIGTAQALQPHAIHVVVGHAAEQVRGAMQDAEINLEAVQWCLQQPQLGSGHAALQALSKVNPESRVLLLNGDVPLISVASLQRLVQLEGGLNLLTTVLDNPFGLGRIIRNPQQDIVAIVEEKDATAAQKSLCEVNTNFICGAAAQLATWLNRLNNDNAQNEFYLTDIIAQAVADGVRVGSAQPVNPQEVLGVNDKIELARLERIWQSQQAERLLQAGVTLLDPSRVEVRGECRFGRDCEVDINVIFEGENHFGARCRIGPNCLIRNSVIGDDCQVAAHCVLDGVTLGTHCQVGPYARIRPHSRLSDHVHVGNFVEVKNSQIDTASKLNHLSYVGDARLGQRVNIGAGVITCNYDGAHKHQTLIGDDVFVGSDSQLIAPVELAAGATIGAGSTITHSVAKNTLAVARARQRSVPNWQRPRKAE